MVTLRRLARTLLAAAVCAAFVLIPAAGAQAATMPPGSNLYLGTQTSFTTRGYAPWAPWSQPDQVYLYTDGSGTLRCVTVDTTTHQLTVTPVDTAARTLGTPTTISFSDFPLWGGFYAAPDGSLYIAVGQSNTEESTTKQVVAVRKYDQSWTLRGTGYLLGGATQMFPGVYLPFEAGRADMALAGSTLVVHMARQMFIDADGLRHQSNLTFEVNTSTMAVTTLDAAWGTWPYSSHSFNQFVRTSGNDLVFVDHGDAYPRSIQVAVATGGAATPTAAHTLATANIFPFDGQTGDNYTGTTLTGVETGSGAVLATGSSVPHDQAINGITGSSATAQNAYLISTDVTTRTPSFTWLTGYDPNGRTTVGEPRMVKLSDTRFAIFFDVTDGTSHTLHYELRDASGARIAAQDFPGVVFNPISQPIAQGSKVYWASYGVASVSSTARLFLFSLDLAPPTAPALAAAPSVTAGTPSVTGSAAVGSTLTANPGTWSPAASTFSYQWLRDGVAITGATAATYAPTAADLGAALSVSVTGDLLNYTATTATSAATAAVILGTLTAPVPTISGTTTVGRTLTATTGTWTTGATLSYQWLRDGAAISGATASSYVLTPADAGTTVAIRVTGSLAGYPTSSVTSDPTAVIAAAPAEPVLRQLTTVKPKISGKAKVRKKLTVKAGKWQPATVKLTYQWKRNGVPIPKATKTKYKLVKADKRKRITVTVTGRASGYQTASATSAATKKVKQSRAPRYSSASRAAGSCR